MCFRLIAFCELVIFSPSSLCFECLRVSIIFDLWLLLPAAGGTKAGEIAPVVVHMRPMDEDGACVRSHISISTLCTNQPEIARIFDHANIDVSSASIGAVANQSEMSCPEYV